MRLPDWILEWDRTPASWKFAVGGRGSAKSHSIVRMAMVRGTQRRISVLCLRETMASLEDSVLKLIREVIAEEPAFSAFYKAGRNRVTGANGTEFRFSGLSETHGTETSIRGAESVDIFLIDEGQLISDESLRHLTPTIRKEGAEVWVAMNPRFDDDPLYVMSQQEDEDILTYAINWTENPYWSERQEKERVRFKRMHPDLYGHEYEGLLMPDTTGRMFNRGDFKLVDRAPEGRSVRGWDFATGAHAQSDRTAGVRIIETGSGDSRRWWIVDATAGRWPPGEVLDVVRSTAARDGVETKHVFEQESGGAGANWVQSCVTAIAPSVGEGVRPTGDKAVRARGLAAQVAAGNVRVVRGPWVEALLREMSRFPDEGRHDDRVDAAAHAFNDLAGSGPMPGFSETFDEWLES